MRSVLSAVLLFFSLGLLVGHAQSKAHLPEAKTDTIPVKATDTIPVKVADTIPVKTSEIPCHCKFETLYLINFPTAQRS